MLSKLSRATGDVSTRVCTRYLSISTTAVEFPLKQATTAVPAKKAELSAGSLSNGVKMAFSHHTGSTASIRVAVLGGSSAETLDEKGSAQLLGSSAFDGNKNKSGLLTMREFEDIGAKVAATSDREKIVYSVLVPNEHLGTALELLVANIKSPIHKSYMIEEAKSRAQIAYDTHAGCGSSRLTELLHDASYGENTPLGSSRFAHSLDDLTPTDVIHYRNSVFSSDNLRIAVHGDIAGSKAKNILEDKCASGFATGSRPIVSPFTGGEIRVREHTGGLTRVGLSFALPAGDEKSVQVLRHILHSRLASKEGHVQIHMHSNVHHANNNATGGLTKTFLHAYKAGGMFGVTFRGDVAFVNKGLTDSIAELKKIASGTLPDEELSVIKNKIQLETLLAAEGSGAADALLKSLIAGSAAEADVSAVTKEAVVNAAKAALKSAPGYAVLGTTYHVPSLSAVVKLLA